MDPDLRRLCAALADGGGSPLDPGLFDLAREHRVDALLAGRAGDRERLRAAAARSLALEREVTTICDRASAAGVDLLLLKGVALAYTHYAAPHLRPRVDIDLLIRRHQLDSTGRLLVDLGYSRVVEADAELWTGQRHYVKTSATGEMLVDLHWRVANPLAFAGALDFDDVWPRAVAVPALGVQARTLSPADSLLLACLHRVAHHQDRVDLLWLWDIHLLASRMPAEDLARFASSALRARAGQVCSRGLRLAQECFGTALPAAMLEQLASAGDEPSAAFIGSVKSPFDVARADMAALAGWRQRASLLREHLFPPASYMRRRYSGWPVALLPVAYVHRMVVGAPRWLRR